MVISRRQFQITNKLIPGLSSSPLPRSKRDGRVTKSGRTWENNDNHHCISCMSTLALRIWPISYHQYFVCFQEKKRNNYQQIYHRYISHKHFCHLSTADLLIRYKFDIPPAEVRPIMKRRKMFLKNHNATLLRAELKLQQYDSRNAVRSK